MYTYRLPLLYNFKVHNPKEQFSRFSIFSVSPIDRHTDKSYLSEGIATSFFQKHILRHEPAMIFDCGFHVVEVFCVLNKHIRDDILHIYEMFKICEK